MLGSLGRSGFVAIEGLRLRRVMRMTTVSVVVRAFAVVGVGIAIILGVRCRTPYMAMLVVGTAASAQ